MTPAATITFTVTNDLSYDQRMHRICHSLAMAGYDILLIGRKQRHSIPLMKQSFRQKRLTCIFNKGFLFYAEYNLRLFLVLLLQQATVFCAIDLDTILPNYLVSVLKRRKRVYDAHELFTEQKEIITRPWVHAFWKMIERLTVPEFSYGYTVNAFIRQQFLHAYGVDYAVIRNLPLRSSAVCLPAPHHNLIIYQGAVNEGRCFETLIPAMKKVHGQLLICGNGNFFDQLQALIKKHGLEGKVVWKGAVPPGELKQLTPRAMLGLTLFEPTGLNQYHSLSNRFFDYVMAGIPQVCMAYPEYQAMNHVYHVALLIEDAREDTIARALNNLLSNTVVYRELQCNCLKARAVWNWEKEENILLDYYRHIME